MPDGDDTCGRRSNIAGALGMIDDKLAEIDESLLQGKLDEAERGIRWLRRRLAAVSAILDLADTVTARRDAR